MIKSADSQPRRTTMDTLEETFKRYEPKEEIPTFPEIGEEAQRIPSVEKAAEKPQTITLLPPLKLVNTGIPGLDNVLDGGIADRSLILVCGETGSHHNTFIEQILYNHAIENGKATYYNTETLSIDIRQEMEQFGWTLQDFLKRGTWTFTNLRTTDLQQLSALMPKMLSDDQNIQLATNLSNLKNDLLTKIKTNHWTTIELNHLLLNFNLKEVIDLMLYWRAAIRLFGGLHFAVLPIGVHPDNQIKAIESVADGVIEFHLREGPHDYETTMSIRKTKNMLKPLILPFTVSESGINIETAQRIT